MKNVILPNIFVGTIANAQNSKEAVENYGSLATSAPTPLIRNNEKLEKDLEKAEALAKRKKMATLVLG